MHGAQRRRHAAAASQGAWAAHGHQARRSCFLFHDLRVDDVELARKFASARLDDCSLRRRPVLAEERKPVGYGGTTADYRLRNQRKISCYVREAWSRST